MAEWKELPATTEEGKRILYVRQAGRTPATGYEIVDPKTGGAIGHLSRIDVSRREIGGRKQDVSWTFVSARPEVEESIRRAEEKKEVKELAQKEAEFEAKRIREGKIKPEDVVLTQKGSKEILEKILRERAEARPPTREEERRHRIARLQAKITGREVRETLMRKIPQPKDTFLASEKFIELWKKREPEIKRVLEREAGLKAWKEERLKREKEFEAERARIEPYREIWKMKPSWEKAKKYVSAWLKAPKEFEAARKELRYEAVYMGDKKISLQLAAARPFTYVREKPFKTALIVGAVAAPALGVVSKIPVVKVLATKQVLYTISGLWVGAKGYEAYVKAKREPEYYKGLAGKVELISEPVTEVGGFITGAAVSAKAIAIGGKVVKTAAVKAGIQYKTGYVAPKPAIGKGKPPKPEKITLIRSELEAKLFRGRLTKEYISLKTWGLAGRRAVFVERIRPIKITGIKTPKVSLKKFKKIKFKFELVEAPPSYIRYDVELGRKPLIRKFAVGMAPIFEKPFELKISGVKDYWALPKGKPVEIITTGLKPALKERFALPKGKPVEIEKKGKIKDLFKLELPKGKPVEIEIIKPPKKKFLPMKPIELVGLSALAKGIKSQFALPKGKPISAELAYVSEYYRYRPSDWAKILVTERRPITFKTLAKDVFILPKGKPITIKTTGVKDYWALPKGKPISAELVSVSFKLRKPYYEFKIAIPKIVGAEVVRREVGYPLKFKAAKLYAAKGLVDVRYFSAMRDYWQMKIPSERPPPPKELEKEYFKPVKLESGAIIGIRGVYYPSGRVRDIPLKKPLAMPTAKPERRKAAEIWKAPPPTERPTRYVETGAEGRRLIQIQKTKQESISKQVSKQVFKQQQAQVQKSILISKSALKEELTQKQKQKQKSLLASLSISALAQESVSELKSAQAQKRKMLVGLVSVSALARPSISLPKKVSVQIKEPRYWREQLQEYEQILEEPKKPKEPPIGWLPFDRKGMGESVAYDVWVKRFGKFKKISAGPLPKKRALRLGARRVKRTLAAQFKLTPAKVKTTMKDIEFIPSKMVFRAHKIKEGRKVPLPEGQYIQYAHKRLSKVGEVREIMAAKKREEIKKKWRF